MGKTCSSLIASRPATKCVEKVPTKPCSAYNVFFSFESARQRKRRKVFKKYARSLSKTKWIFTDSALDFGRQKNTTKLIAEKWKRFDYPVHSYFIVQAKAHLEAYLAQFKIFEAKKKHTLLEGKRRLQAYALRAALGNRWYRHGVFNEMVWFLA